MKIFTKSKWEVITYNPRSKHYLFFKLPYDGVKDISNFKEQFEKARKSNTVFYVPKGVEVQLIKTTKKKRSKGNELPNTKTS